MESRWGSLVEIETKLRIKLSVAAYAYEIEDDEIIDDYSYDMLCLKINTDIVTGNSVLDEFFKEHFDPSTGNWIHKHPQLEKIKQIYEEHYMEDDDDLFDI